MRIATSLALVSMLLAPSAVLAAPPPPAIAPQALEQPVEGYDLRIPFQLWRYRVEAQKGEVADALLAKPEILDGEQAIGRPILEFRAHNDFGHFLTGEIRVYCRPLRPHGFDRASCHYRLRRAFVPFDAANYGEDNPVSRWTRESFDAATVARRLRGLGLPPDSDWWMVRDRATMFATLPSAAEVLEANAKVVRLDSRDCPAMKRAVEALDGARVDWSLDLLAVGADGKVEAPAPHAVTFDYTVRSMVEGGLVAVTGSGRAVDALVRPVLDAANACENIR